ncbi:endodeoxyribonuclease, partial [Nowakowskiella sp. JEL0078]
MATRRLISILSEPDEDSILHSLTLQELNQPESDCYDFASLMSDFNDSEYNHQKADYSVTTMKPSRKIFIVTDPDPHGIGIARCYKFGSKALRFENSALAIASMEWLGIDPRDWVKLGLLDFEEAIETCKLIELTEKDKSLIRNMLKDEKITEWSSV